MKKHTFLLFMVWTTSAIADEFVQMTNGMTCWRNNSTGYMYGCAGGVDTGAGGFNDMTGNFYSNIAPNQAINPKTGQSIYTPYRGN